MRTPASEVTLEQMLQAREDRVEKQNELIGQYALPLVSLTVNMPGAYKNTPASTRVFHEEYDKFIQMLYENVNPPVYQEARELVTGSEGYIVVDMDVRALKGLALQIETGHQLGRLFDLDVIGRDGQAVSRETLGYPKRKCLLCEEEAHACARSRAHPVEELIEKILQMIEDKK
jgi:holo-ACP synthase